MTINAEIKTLERGSNSMNTNTNLNGVKMTEIKTRQQRQAEKWPNHPGNTLAPWARLKLADAEISDLRAEVARLQAALADRDAKQVDKAGQFDWMNAERIRDEDHVDEALRAFREDPTGDNATGIIQAALTVWNADAAAIAQRVGCGEPAAWRIQYPDGVVIHTAGETIPKAYARFATPLFYGTILPDAVQQSVGGAEPLPEGWSATHMPPWDALTDEAQHESRISVKREVPPFCDKAGMRIWSAPTLHEALAKACSALGLPAYTPPAAVTDAEHYNAVLDDVVALHLKYLSRDTVETCGYFMDSILAMKKPASYEARTSAATDADKRDAVRYRWLRDTAAYVGVNPHVKTCLWTLRGIYELPEQGFDAAIDAAIAASEQYAVLPACQCFTEQQEQYCVRQRKCAGKATAYVAAAPSPEAQDNKQGDVQP